MKIKPPLLPALVVFNDSFKVVRRLFCINADQRYNGGDVEEPYQSAQDSEGNIYIATIQFLPFEEKFVLISGYRSIFITKFDKEYNHLWTTIDTVFHDACTMAMQVTYQECRSLPVVAYLLQVIMRWTQPR